MRTLVSLESTSTGYSFSMPKYGLSSREAVSDVPRFVLDRTVPIYRHEIRKISNDIENIITETIRAWREIKDLGLLELPSDYVLPPIEPQKTRYIKSRIVSRKKGGVNFNFLRDYEDLF